MDQVLNYAIAKEFGVFALLFIALLAYVLKTNFQREGQYVSMIDKFGDVINGKVACIEKQVDDVKGKVDNLSKEVDEVKVDVKGMRSDMNGMKKDVYDIKDVVSHRETLVKPKV